MCFVFGKHCFCLKDSASLLEKPLFVEGFSRFVFGKPSSLQGFLCFSGKNIFFKGFCCCCLESHFYITRIQQSFGNPFILQGFRWFFKTTVFTRIRVLFGTPYLLKGFCFLFIDNHIFHTESAGFLENMISYKDFAGFLENKICYKDSVVFLRKLHNRDNAC